MSTLFDGSMSNATSKLKLPSARVTAPEDARNAAGNDGGVPVSAKTVSVSATTDMRRSGLVRVVAGGGADATSGEPTDETQQSSFMS